MRIRQTPRRRGRKGFCTQYRHYWTGKLMRASDYGYKAWPFGRG